MRCPFCGHEDTQVKDSRPADDGSAIRRRRLCGNCGQRFTTVERVQLRELSVVKADGRRVPFERDKLARSIRIALRKRPVDEERIERIVNGIVRQLEAPGDSEMPSNEIGELVMETLKEVDAVAYVRFASVYRDFREARDFEAFLGSLDDAHIGAMQDAEHMRAALALARRGLGNTWPNPAVGCVIVRDGRVVGRGCDRAGRPAACRGGGARHGRRGRARRHRLCHARALQPSRPDPALRRRADRGRRQPRGDRLRRPVPAVNGAGIARLRAAGIEVRDRPAAGGGARRCRRASCTRIRHGRPLVTLKLATTLDGRIATAWRREPVDHRPEARRAAHALRAQHDAVLVGVGTVQTDDPDLTCRIPGFRAGPDLRIVADSHLRTRLLPRVVATAREVPTWFCTRAGADPGARRGAAPSRRPAVRGADGRGRHRSRRRAWPRWPRPGSPGCWSRAARSSPAPCCGPAWSTASPGSMRPRVMGGDGWPAAQAFGVAELAAMPRFVRTGPALGPTCSAPTGANVGRPRAR